MSLQEPRAAEDGRVSLEATLPARHIAAFLQGVPLDRDWDLEYWESDASSRLAPGPFRPGSVHLLRMPGAPSVALWRVPRPGAEPALPPYRPGLEDGDVDSTSSSSSDSGESWDEDPSAPDGRERPRHRRKHGVLDGTARALRRVAIRGAARGWRVEDSDVEADPPPPDFLGAPIHPDLVGPPLPPPPEPPFAPLPDPPADALQYLFLLATTPEVCQICLRLAALVADMGVAVVVAMAPELREERGLFLGGHSQFQN